MLSRSIHAAFLSVCCMVGIGCTQHTHEEYPDPPMFKHATAASTLYAQLGGDLQIRAIAVAWVDAVKVDQRLHFVTGQVDTALLINRTAQYLGAKTGGPEKYFGVSMPFVDLKIVGNSIEWAALMEDLLSASLEVGVPLNTTVDFLKTIEPLGQKIWDHSK